MKWLSRDHSRKWNQRSHIKDLTRSTRSTRSFDFCRIRGRTSRNHLASDSCIQATRWHRHLQGSPYVILGRAGWVTELQLDEAVKGNKGSARNASWTTSSQKTSWNALKSQTDDIYAGNSIRGRSFLLTASCWRFAVQLLLNKRPILSSVSGRRGDQA